ncbi:hypothetical protein GCM10007301_10400 [Azorhizobium oxalatiphilum]|uniref:Chromosomal replication initiator DnaA C-terminal domain-containing protein n=1 Tax=Azorhizobium oxalatiphilum TaxID=980631 RepID=A0A917BQ59_9HYPH|nr:helix-turn-helix domain-containing protein [Azorhizobium oxalatiphilum]GGF52829.1 hypothetical protein GCM10007301_10400 [Azorhizobium oxalatiphilum]
MTCLIPRGPLSRRRRHCSRTCSVSMLLARTPLALPAPAAAPVLPIPAQDADPAFLCRLATALAARRRAAAGPAPEGAPIVSARQLAMYLAHVVLGLSQVQVAHRFGRDRRTVAHALKRVEQRRDEAGYDAEVIAAEQLLRWVVQP